MEAAAAAAGVECCTLVNGEQGVTTGLPQYPELLVFNDVCAICNDTAVSELTLARAGGLTANPPPPDMNETVA